MPVFLSVRRGGRRLGPAVQQHALIFRELSRLFFDTPHEDLALALTMLAMLCSQGRDHTVAYGVPDPPVGD